MPRLVRPLVLLLVLLAAAAVAPAHAGEAAFTRGLLWKVERPGAKPSYVFGTMHSSDAKILALPKAVRTAFYGADSVSIELEVTSDILAQMESAGRAKGGMTLDRVIRPELLEAVVKKAAEYGLKREDVLALKPWAVAELLFSAPPSEQKKQKRDSTPFLDLWLLLEAMRQGKPHFGLESVEEQIAVFSGMPRAVQVGLLESSLRGTADEDEFSLMRKQYLDRDIAGLLEHWRGWLAELEPGDAAVLNARMLDDRNRRMVRRMKVRLAEGNAFICMGAAHLPGEAGVLNLLRLQGYKLTAVY